MRFQKFNEFLHKREGVNRTAFDYDRKLAQFNSRFKDHKEGEKIVLAAGYGSISEFLRDKDERKWSRLKIPGQENYRE